MHFQSSDLSGLLSFGLYQMGERSVNFLAANVDYVVIGRFLGSEPLGFYRLAYELVIVPMRLVNPVFNRVTFPLFSIRQQDNIALQRGYQDLIRAMALILAPIYVGMVVTAPLLVSVVYSDAWSAAIPLVQILAIVGFLKALITPTASIFLAKGRVDIGFKWNLLVAVVNTIAFSIAAILIGLYAVAWTYAGLSVLYVIGVAIILKRQIHLSILSYIDAVLQTLTLGVVMGTVVYLAYEMAQDAAAPDLILLIGMIAVGGVCYSLLCLVFKRQFIIEMWLLFKRRPEVA